MITLVLVAWCLVLGAAVLYGFAALVRGFERGWTPEDRDRGGAR